VAASTRSASCGEKRPKKGVLAARGGGCTPRALGDSALLRATITPSGFRFDNACTAGKKIFVGGAA
jgi:hypothetical protein